MATYKPAPICIRPQGAALVPAMMEMHLRKVPKNIHKSFKRLCKERGVTMNSALIDHMRKEVLETRKRALS